MVTSGFLLVLLRFHCKVIFECIVPDGARGVSFESAVRCAAAAIHILCRPPHELMTAAVRVCRGRRKLA